MNREEVGAEPRQTESVAKRRSPAERLIVWGAIALLILAAAYEGWGRFGYTRTLSAWNAALDAAEEAENGERFTLSQATRLAAGTPSRSPLERKGQWHVTSYRWGSLLHNYEITLKCLDGEDPQIVLLETGDGSEDDESEKPLDIATQPMHGDQEPSGPPQLQDSSPPSAVSPTAAGYIMSGMDVDQDGKLSPQEASDRVRPYFGHLDQDGDGFLSYEELVTAPSLEDPPQPPAAEGQAPTGAAARPMR